MFSKSENCLPGHKNLLFFAFLVPAAIGTSAAKADQCPGFSMPADHCPAVDLSACGPEDLQCRAEKLIACPSRKQVPAGYVPYKLKVDFPENKPEAEQWPWLSFDPFTAKTQQERAEQSEAYIQAVLSYVLEGNVYVDAETDAEFRVGDNKVRDWYHAPWMHFDDSNGREPLHGLTRELCSRPGVLHSKQTADTDSWAVGFYNAPGGYEIGRVWQSWVEAAKCPSAPVKPVQIDFPNGSVSFKLLFTTATADQVPFLEGAPFWKAAISPTPKEPKALFCDAGYAEGVHDLRLLQLDIAVKDMRSGNPTGWVFGTFIYDKEATASTNWEKLTPVGLQWGNDPDRERLDLAGKDPATWWQVPLREGWINPQVAGQFKAEGREWLGLHGRLNGPVDNWRSGCTACHSVQAVGHKLGASLLERPGEYTLPWHACGNAVPNIGEPCPVNARIREYFENRTGDQSYLKDYLPLDYSLQLAKGLENYVNWLNAARVSGEARLQALGQEGQQNLQIEIPRSPTASVRR